MKLVAKPPDLKSVEIEKQKGATLGKITVEIGEGDTTHRYTVIGRLTRS